MLVGNEKKHIKCSAKSKEYISSTKAIRPFAEMCLQQEHQESCFFDDNGNEIFPNDLVLEPAVIHIIP